jgi:polyphosphate kinase 2 (PPK2 family)
MLEIVDLSQKLKKAEYKAVIPEMQERLLAVQQASWQVKLPVIIVFEAWNGAGKGDLIQYLAQFLDPRGFKLYPIRGARTFEKNRPWLWRYWMKLPERGEWAIFDRSWYRQVLEERFENRIAEREWRRAFRDIVDFERLLTEDGYVLFKFFLHVSKEEQKKRFEKLAKDPLTAWRVSPEDWQQYRKHDAWISIFEENFEQTDTEWCPWTIIGASDDRYARLRVIEIIVQRLEAILHSENRLMDEVSHSENDV